MPKKRTFVQRVGRRGEDAFRPFASRHGLLATKVEEDVGFDFLCQVEEPAGGRTRAILGSLIGVSVRSSSARSVRVRLDRSDAEAMLQATFVVCFVLVEVRPDSEQVWYRFLDETFALELADFLASDNSYRYVTPKHCSTSGSFESDLIAALNGNMPERVRIAVANRRMERHLPDVSLEIHRSPEGELTLVSVQDFYSYFVRGDVPVRDDAYVAIFGSPRLRGERLAGVGPRPEVVQELARLPSAWLFGATTEAECNVAVVDSDGRDEVEFTRVTSPTHYGWVHDAGFSITVSHRKRDGDRWVHEIDALIDPDEELDLRAHPELWQFLERCTAGAKLFPVDEPKRRFDVDHIRGLQNASFFARCLRPAVKLPGWESVVSPLRLATADEALHTMAWMAEMADHPAALDNFGFVLESATISVEDPVRCEVPVIANLGGQSLVTWLDADVTLLSVDDRARGLRIDEVHGVSLEVLPLLEKASVYPELVVHESWPAIALEPTGAHQSTSDPKGWGLGVRDIRARE